MLKIKTINTGTGEIDLYFTCTSRATRNGFAHDCVLLVNGKQYKATVNYYNRTWEKHEFQTIMKKAAQLYINDSYMRIVESFKKTNGYKRMNKHRYDQLFMSSAYNCFDNFRCEVLRAL